MNDYCLVDCDFHDQLEALATLRQTGRISYHTVTGEIVEVQERIVDVYAASSLQHTNKWFLVEESKKEVAKRQLT